MLSPRLILSVSLLASPLFAQVPGEFQAGEFGCPNVCHSQNDPPASFIARSLPNEYCHAVQMATAETVAGFSFYFETVSGSPATIQAALYRENANSPGTPDPNPVAIAMIEVAGPLDWYAAVLDTPISTTANELFFISADTNAVRPPDDGAGGATPAPSFWRRPPFGGTAWAQTGIINSPIYRIHCLGSTAGVTTLTSSALPVINSTFAMDIGGCPPGAITFMFLGALPGNIDLTPLGAPGCAVNILPILGDSAPAIANGSGVATYSLPIPNDPALVSVPLRVQSLVNDASATGLGFVTSTDAKLTIGG